MAPCTMITHALLGEFLGWFDLTNSNAVVLITDTKNIAGPGLTKLPGAIALSGKSREVAIMLRELKKLLCSSVTFGICLLLLICPAPAADKPPAVGDTLPTIKLALPEDSQTRTYLGLEGSGQFAVPQIKAEVVVIEIFNMY